MRVVMFGLAASAAWLASAAPALAGESFIPDHVSVAAQPSFFGSSGFKHGGRNRGGDGGGNGIWVNGGEWAQHNNRSFDSDAFNDWWHDRPDRAYPAWMRGNQQCQRLWYAGSELRC